MAKDITETTAGKAIAAWVILNPKGVQCGQVQAFYAGTGGVTVNVRLWGDDMTQQTAEAMGYAFDDAGKITTFNGKATPHAGEYAYKVAGLQTAHAGGYGYDKFTACLSGLFIGPHKMSDHCGGVMKRPRGRLWQDGDKARLAKKGYRLSNYIGPIDETTDARDIDYKRARRGKGVPDTASGYVDAYRMEGFGYPESQGFKFLKAI